MLHITCAASLHDLAEACAGVLTQAPTDPFTPEWIATPSGAVRGWLERRLAASLGASEPSGSLRNGITANVVQARADDLRRGLLGFTSNSRGPIDQWSTDSMTWRLMALAGKGKITRDGDEPLASWAQRQARRFDRYHVHRSEMIRSWVRGEDVGDAFQASVYRTLVASADQPNPVAGLDSITADAASVFPPRLVFFGFLLPPEGEGFVDLVTPVASEHDVHCFFVDPAPGVATHERGGLAGSWGSEDIAALSLRDRLVGKAATAWTDITPAKPSGNTTLLERLQASIHHGEVEPTALATGDRSVRVHACHGLTRQIEVIRDDILHHLRADPTLQEEDIAVLCADPAALAPVIAAVLGDSARPGCPLESTDHTPALRYHIDGLSSRRSNPVADGFARLLDLIDGRITSVELLDFIQLEAVRNRWGLDDEDIATFRGWAHDANVRWGIDTRQRARFDIPISLGLGTWARAIERLALGAAYASDELVLQRPDGPTTPIGIEGDGVERLGKLRDIIERIRDLGNGDPGDDDPTSPEPRQTTQLGADVWMKRLEAALGELFAADADQPDQLTRMQELCTIPASLDDSYAGFPISFADLRPYLLAKLERSSSGSAAFRGGVTFTTPEAARGVPYRVVVLADLNDEWIPAGAGDGGDLIIADPSKGDPDPRASAKLSLLSAVTDATDALVITRNASSLTTNEHLGEGVLVGELFDAIADTVVGDGADHRNVVIEALTLQHPRQSTAPVCFDTDSDLAATAGYGIPWSFDTTALLAARHTVNARTDRWPVPGDTPVYRRVTERPTVVHLDDLCAFLRHPDRYVVRHTMDVRLPFDDGDLSEHLATELGPLEKYALRKRLLDALQAGEDHLAIRDFEAAADRLPCAVTGDFAFSDELIPVDKILSRADDYRKGRSAQDVDVHVDLPGGRRLVGSVAALVSEHDGVILDLGVSKEVKPGERLAAAARLFAVAASDERTWWNTSLRCKGRSDMAGFKILIDADPFRHDRLVGKLAELVALFDVAQLGAVPLPTTLVGLTKADWSKNWRTSFAEQLGKEQASRFLYGFREAAMFRRLAVHPDDPHPPDLAMSQDPDTDRAELLRQVLVDNAHGNLLAGTRKSKGLVRDDG